jgi:hypothetical protein
MAKKTCGLRLPQPPTVKYDENHLTSLTFPV